VKGIKKIIMIVGAIILLVGLILLGKAARDKYNENRNNDYKERVAAKEQDAPKITFTPGNIQNPIRMEKIISKWKGEYYVNPGDSIWFSCDPRADHYQTKFVDPEGKFLLYRGLSKKPLTETFQKPIPNNKMIGINLFCIKNIGEGIVVVYAWYGWRSPQQIQRLGTIN